MRAAAPSGRRRGLVDRSGLLDYLPADGELRHNARQSLLDGMAYSIAPGFFDPFRSVFAISLGATDYMLGLLVSLPAVTNMLGQVLGAWLTGRAARRLPIVVVSAFISRLFFLLFAALPFLPGSRAWVFVAAVTLMNLPLGVTNLAWTTLMQKLFPPAYRGKVFGQRNAILGAVTISATLACGWLLSVIRFPFNYSLLSLVAFVFLMVSLHFLTTLREPVESGPRPPGTATLASVRRILANRPFTRFLAGMLVLQFGLSMPAALYPILLVRQLRISTAWIGLMATGGGLAAVLIYSFWGRISDRLGHRWTLVRTALVWPLGSAAYCFIQAPYLPAAVEFSFGLLTSGFNLCLFNYLLEVSPPRESPAYIAFYNVATSLVVLAAPVVGVWTAGLVGVRGGIGVASAVRAAGVGLLWALVGSHSHARTPAGEVRASGIPAGR